MCEAVLKASWVMSIHRCAALTQLQMHCFLLFPERRASLVSALMLTFSLALRKTEQSLPGDDSVTFVVFLFSRCQVEANLSWVCVSGVGMSEVGVFVSSSCEFADAD